MVLRGDFGSFSTPTLAVDPTGTLVAVGDDGGSDETAMGMVTARGTPKVTLFDGGNSSSLGTVESGKLTHRLEVDPFRRRLFTCTYEDVGVWSFDGQPLRRFRPYAGTFARSLAVCERFLATSPNLVSTLDLWDPMTFERVATVNLGQTSADWISISPDGSLLLVPALPQQRDFGFRTVHVNG